MAAAMEQSSRILLILDIDETLIHGSEAELTRPADFKIGPYHVYCRPHLTHFLNQVAEVYELAVWSSGSQDYVDAVVDAIMPNGVQPALVWARDRCTRRFDPELREEYYVKDLKKIKRQGYVLDRMLIVEDTARKVERNYGNAIYMEPYYGDTEDDELLRLGSYLCSISSTENVRTLEKRGWQAGISSQGRTSER
jgi:TFIIF-interacting CTD phosphatase-like protein